jgi:dihydroxyacid dehydratase/phosphogluconate dehydratase
LQKKKTSVLMLEAIKILLEKISNQDIMTREAFENAITMCHFGGSTNAVMHLNASSFC